MLFLRRYLAALAVLLLVYAVYAVAVVPWLEPPPLPRRTPVTRERLLPSTRLADDLAQLFPPDAWERQNPKLVETEQATLLIREYQPLPDGRLELKPCTLIFHLGGRAALPAEPPPGPGPDAGASPPVAASPAATMPRRLVLQSPRAELVFDRPLDLRSGQFGRVEKGTLIGPITIFSPPTQPDGSDHLRITTDTLWLNRESISTAGQVDFQFGLNSGHGRDLEITLLPLPAGGPRGGRQPALSLHTLTLKQVEWLRVVAGSGELWGRRDVTGQHSAAEPPPATATTFLEIACRGPLTLDVPSQQAHFEEEVEVRRLVPGAPPDRLRCDALWLHFALRSAETVTRPPLPSPPHLEPRTGPEGTAPTSAAKPPPPPPLRAEDPLAGRLKRIVARGSPVVLDAPASQLRVEADHLEYALPEQMFILRPADTHASARASHPVRMVRQQQSFLARQLYYQAEGSGRLGRLWAEGPGEMRLVQATQPAPQTITLRWEKELRVQPQDRNQVISLVDAASVTVEPLGRFDAKEIHLWVLETSPAAKVAPLAGGPAARPEPGLQPAANKASPPAPVILPDRLLAVGDVRLASPQMDAQTSRLEVWFLNLPPELPPPPRPADQPLSEPVQPAAFAPPPASAPAEREPSPTLPPVPAGLQKFHVSGGLIQMQLVLRGQAGDLEDLSIRGHAAIDELRTPHPGQVPIRVRGHVLQLRHGTQPHATIDITGQPAELGGRGLWLAGGHIHIHRGRNELRIDGPGEASWPSPLAEEQALIPLAGSTTPPRPASGPGNFPAQGDRFAAGLPLPAASQAELPAAGEDGAAVAAASPMHVVWQQGMRFDGLTARFEGEVQIRTARQTVLAAALEATLSERVAFQPSGGMPQAELAQVSLEGGPSGLLLEHRAFDEQGALAAHERLVVRNLFIDRTSGRLSADGPGWLSSVRPAAGMARAASGRAAGGVLSPSMPRAELGPPAGAVPSPPWPGGGGPLPERSPGGPLPFGEADPTPTAAGAQAAPQGLASIHVAFERGMVGRLDERWIEFQQQVRTTYRPAEDWSDVRSASRPEELDPRGLVITSDQLRLTQMAVGTRRWFELLATGQVLIEGHELTIQAPRVGYTSDKEVLTIEGQGRVMARAWVGRQRNFLEGQRLQYNLRTGAATTDRIQNIRIQLGSDAALPLPGRPGP